MARYYNDGHCSHCELQGESGEPGGCKACASCLRFHAAMDLYSRGSEYVKSTPGFIGRKIVNERE